MRDALAAAERASRAKTEFLSWASHELRTPLHSILGFAEVLEMRTLAPADATAVEHIRSAGDQLLHLVDDLLDVSPLAADSLVLDAQPVDVDAAVEESIARTAEDAARASVAITFRPGSPGTAQADPGRLHQVLVRLLHNAVTRSPAGSRVEVRSYPAGRAWVQVEVATGGPVGSPTERSDGLGAGMGLVVAQQLVHAMGGDVRVQRDDAGGSVFTVALPVA